MASGGSGKRPPRSHHRPNSHNLRGVDQRARQGQGKAKRQKVAGAQTGDIFWRRLRQRIRSLWRWMVVRTVRSLANRWNGRVEGINQPGAGGDVRQFPGGK